MINKSTEKTPTHQLIVQIIKLLDQVLPESSSPTDSTTLDQRQRILKTINLMKLKSTLTLDDEAQLTRIRQQLEEKVKTIQSLAVETDTHPTATTSTPSSSSLT